MKPISLLCLMIFVVAGCDRGRSAKSRGGEGFDAATRDTVGEAIADAATAAAADAPTGDEGAADALADGPEAGVPTPSERRRMFHYHNGTLGKIRDSAETRRTALEVADDDCTTGAKRMGLGGTWKAWLSSSTADAIDRIAEVGPWYRLDRATKLFENKQQMRSGPLAAISPTRDQASDVRNLFWTGTGVDGTKTAFLCKDWTDYLLPLQGTVGRADVAGSGWAMATPIDCGTYLGLLCVEQ